MTAPLTAGALGLVNGITITGGFVAPKEQTGGYSAALAMLAFTLVMCAAIVLALGSRAVAARGKGGGKNMTGGAVFVDARPRERGRATTPRECYMNAVIRHLGGAAMVGAKATQEK